MEKRDFDKDLNDSHLLDEEWIRIFKKAFGEDTSIKFKNDHTSQVDFGTDVIITLKNGRRYSVECKTRRHDYFKVPSFILEVVHNRYSNEKKDNLLTQVPGWLYKGTFDYIFFGTKDEKGNKIVEVFGFSSHPFKSEEYKSNLNNYPNGWASTKYSNGCYQETINKVIPQEDIERDAIKTWYWVEE